MSRLIDSTLWIDLTRAKSPPYLKAFVASYINDPDVTLAEPVAFELLRFATDTEVKALMAYFVTIPFLATPSDLWTRAAQLGRICRNGGFTPGPIDLLISQVAIQNDAELVTFDRDFVNIASVSNLNVTLLTRPNS